MAKKRVHEIAKERGIPSKEVLATLQAAGLDVKAAASSVDERDIARAFDPAAQEAAAAEEASGNGDGAAPAKTEGAAQRPTRTEGGGGGAAGARRRRVVIDSQASRRAPGPPPQQNQPPRRRGRRRRTPWVEPDLTAKPEVPQEEPIVPINSGATVKEVAESLGLSSPEVIKKLMDLGEMATLTQTLSDEAIGAPAGRGRP